MVLGRKGYWFCDYKCLSQKFISVAMRSINILLGGGFGVSYSDR